MQHEAAAFAALLETGDKICDRVHQGFDAVTRHARNNMHIDSPFAQLVGSRRCFGKVC